MEFSRGASHPRAVRLVSICRLLLQHIQDFRPRRNRSVAGKIWSNRGAVSTLSRSGRNICRPVEVYFHDRAPRSEDTAKAAARQREKIWGLITSPRRSEVGSPTVSRRAGPDKSTWRALIPALRVFFRSRARRSEFVAKASARHREKDWDSTAPQLRSRKSGAGACLCPNKF